MTNRTAKIIALAASGVVVAGLVALATPTVASTVHELSGWAIFQTPTEPTAAPSAAPAPHRKSGLASDPDHYYVGGFGIAYEGPGDCPTNAAIYPFTQGDSKATLYGFITDMGPSEYASGEVTYTADGLVKSYTVAPGDAILGIGNRFCIDYATVIGYNGLADPWRIDPGDVLILRP